MKGIALEAVLLLLGVLIGIGISAWYTHSKPATLTTSAAHPLSSEAIVFAMLRTAETLKDSYSRVLQTKHVGRLRPESSLPASREKIKAALLVVAQSLRASGKLDKTGYDIFQFCYGRLADFVPDDVAARSEKLYRFLFDPESQTRGQADPMWLATELTKIGFPREDANRTNEEFSRLCDDFEYRLNAFDDPARKTEQVSLLQRSLLGS